MRQIINLNCERKNKKKKKQKRKKKKKKCESERTSNKKVPLALKVNFDFCVQFKQKIFFEIFIFYRRS